MSTYRNRLATNFQAQTIAAPVKIPLITLLLLCLSLGCGKEEDVGESAASAPVTLKTEPEEETKKPEPPNAEPKVEVKKLLTKEESAKVIEAVIRKAAKKPVGELTKSDLEKLTQLTTLYLMGNNLSDVKSLENLTQLTDLHLKNNPALTKPQIAELQRALPKCEIHSNPTK
jgi:Leucine-rich repeat (LRR) protein